MDGRRRRRESGARSAAAIVRGRGMLPERVPIRPELERELPRLTPNPGPERVALTKGRRRGPSLHRVVREGGPGAAILAPARRQRSGVKRVRMASAFALAPTSVYSLNSRSAMVVTR